MNIALTLVPVHNNLAGQSENGLALQGESFYLRAFTF